jgi:hypothetical protein
MMYNNTTPPYMVNTLFPDLMGKVKWGHFNLNQIAAGFAQLISLGGPEGNLFKSHSFHSKVIDLICKIKEVDCLWGGYLEDRSVLWNDTYMKPGDAFHLGVDFFVPVNTRVCLPTSAILVESSVSEDMDIGWGGKLVFRWLHGYFVLGHLKDLAVGIGNTYRAGEQVALIAEPEKNGGTPPHLHLQCMKFYDKDVDGYGPMYKGIEADFPDPLNLPW